MLVGFFGLIQRIGLWVTLSKRDRKTLAVERGQNADKNKKRRIIGASKSMMALVAGGGFEPPTFGL